MKHRLKTLLKLTACASITMYFINKYIESSALFRHLLKEDEGNYFNWRHGKVFFTKKGTGAPLLLIHDLNPSSSQKEWDNVISQLSKKYTVYAVDLPGCGRSDKPNIVYSNYFFVQLISDFTQEIIQEKTSVMGTGKSCAFMIMAAKLHPDQISNLTLINPESFGKTRVISDTRSKMIKLLFNCPIVGTFLYYLLTSSNQIDYDFRERFFYNPFHVTRDLENIYYESAHAHNGSGKYLLASLKGNYVNIDVEHAFAELTNTICLIFGREMEYTQDITKAYTRINPSAQCKFIERTKMLPHLEAPGEFLKVF